MQRIRSYRRFKRSYRRLIIRLRVCPGSIISLDKGLGRL